MAEGEITTFTALTEKFNLPPGNYKKPKLLYCSNGGHFLRILPDGTVDGTRDRSDQHSFSTWVLLTLWAGKFFAVGAALCIVGC
ncbi:fibroblast growth factor 1 isoform X3 [Chlorocebus sabaeus]|uniref:fibroblast growth factor 1 isoform X3 n=1 Tax=Chlorocebus sabaeus TaxID=60711 RepID=UPI0018B0827C|nr:fibroblast growth factor 1 isoform X2 [Chlorocebus sabaeus]